MRKAQSAVEFVVLVSFMLLIFFSFFLSFQNKIVEVTRLQDVEYLKEANAVVISEIDLASKMYADYERTFTIPSLADKPFVINLTDSNEITSYYNGVEYVNFLPINITGALLSNSFGGKNTIYRTDGIVYLPDGSIYVNNSFSGFFANVNPELCYYYNKVGDCMPLYKENPLFTDFCFDYFDIDCPACGNGKIEDLESCDNGALSNGVPCTFTSFPDTCTYCSDTCTNITINRGCDDGICEIEYDGNVSYCTDQGPSNDCVGELFMTATPQSEFLLDNNFSTLISSGACQTKGECGWDLLTVKYYDYLGNLVTQPVPYSLIVTTNETENGEFLVNLSNLIMGACFSYTNVTITVNVSKNDFYWFQSFSYPIIGCPYCGNDIPENVTEFNHYEDCDDSSTTSCTPTYGSSCSFCNSSCVWEVISSNYYCGDGVINVSYGEICDNGTSLNGVVCDPGYSISQQTCTYCNSSCLPMLATNSYCGDGVINVSYGETCDNGTGVNTNTPTLPGYGESSLTYCNLTCGEIIYNPPYCGDGDIDALYGENCDPPSTCHPSYGGFCHYCNSTCQDEINYSIEECGDGIIQNPPEICDNGTENTNTPTDPGYGFPAFTYCDLICQTQTHISAYCGDNNCDVGDENAYICPADCPAVCGDGYITHSELCDYNEGSFPVDTCDPGYSSSSVPVCQYCTSSSCTLESITGEYCNDNINQTWDGEVCDLGTANNQCSAPRYESNCSNQDITECCSSSCTSYEINYGGCCGDGTLDSGDGEVCDDGHFNGLCNPPSYKISCPNENTCCSTVCQENTVSGGCCGDGTLDSGDGEVCDAGSFNGLCHPPPYKTQCPPNENTCCSTACQENTVSGGCCGDGTCNSGDEDSSNCPSDCDGGGFIPH